MIHNVLTLNNGIEIPQLGLGTWFIRDDIVADAIKEAVNIGYRHFDTAQAYGNERGVGEGIRNCGIPRDEIFVTSKVAAEHKTYDEVMAGIDETIKKIGLDYLDMMIIHSPQPWEKVNQSEDATKISSLVCNSLIASCSVIPMSLSSQSWFPAVVYENSMNLVLSGRFQNISTKT